MVRALFDTNILIDYLNGVPEAKQELDRHREPAISIVTWMEVMIEPKAEMRDRTRNFLRRFDVIEIDEPIAERAVEVRRMSKIKLPDAIVRASAEVRSMLLVTRNTKDFDAADPTIRVPYVLGRAQ